MNKDNFSSFLVGFAFAVMLAALFTLKYRNDALYLEARDARTKQIQAEQRCNK